MARDPVIVGVAESDLGVTDKSILELQTQAILAALDDAGLGVGRFPTTSVAEYLGIFPTWTDSTSAGGSSYEIFVGHAAEAIRAGRCEVAVVSYGSNQKSARSRSLGGAALPDSPEGAFERPYLPLQPMSMYAMAAQRHMHEFGTTSEQLAEIAVAARAWALLNPRAYRFGAGPLTVDDVLASPLLSSPLHALDCCLITDGGGAVVLTTAERAVDLRTRPVRILGHGETTTHIGIAQMPDLTATGGYTSARRAYAMAGIGPDDVDVWQLYDSFTITVLLTIEAVGLCGRGEGGAFVEGGRIAPGGDVALNTSGGGLSYCHPGMFGIFLVIEAVRQLRGESGDRQIAGAETAVCHGTGGILSTHSTVVLGAER